jgi:tetratricopeptide (TPR) repeat protein
MKTCRALRYAAVALVLLGERAARAQQDSDPAHHQGHGAAVGEIGTVRFPISCDHKAQADFEHGLALLHSFEYALAVGAFRAAAASDPECGIAWWGVAMTYYHPLWAPPTAQDLEQGRQAAERGSSIGGDEREKGFIDAIAAFYTTTADLGARARAYRDRMEALAARRPDDTEAQVFFALALLGSAPPSDASLAQQRRAGEILNAELERNPRHPGAVHYLIHAFDYPGLADVALPAARVYAEIAPASPHAEHMPSHIFTRLGLWPESVRSNLASLAATQAAVAKAGPGAVSTDALHALDYLEYAYLQMGDLDEAHRVLEKALGSTQVYEGAIQSGYALAAIPARYALERHAWKEAAALELPAGALPWERFLFAPATIEFARAIGAARSGDIATARKAIDALGVVKAKLAASPIPGPYDWAGDVESWRLAAVGWLAHAEGKDAEAVDSLRQAATLQDRVGKHPVMPGELIPARELLADLLAELGRPAEALAEYEKTLEVQPGRLNALRGAADAAKGPGDTAKAQRLRTVIDAQLGR